MKNINLVGPPPGGSHNRLIIEVDLDQSFDKSSTGKTIIVATTEGNEKVTDRDGNVYYIGLNVYKYPPR